MPVIRVAGQRTQAHHEAFLDRRGNTDFGAKFVPDLGLALGDEADIRFMQGIDFTAALWGWCSRRETRTKVSRTVSRNAPTGIRPS